MTSWHAADAAEEVVAVAEEDFTVAVVGVASMAEAAALVPPRDARPRCHDLHTAAQAVDTPVAARVPAAPADHRLETYRLPAPGPAAVGADLAFPAVTGRTFRRALAALVATSPAAAHDQITVADQT